MAIVNLRNNTDLFIKVDGFSDVIVPNTPLDDRTFQWDSSDNKSINFFSTETCDGGVVSTSSITFVTEDGIYVNKGVNPNVKLDADITGISARVIQESDGTNEKLLEWTEVNSSTVVNLSFNK